MSVAAGVSRKVKRGIGRIARSGQAVAVATRTLLARTHPVPGLLSIVVPAHDVEPYIDQSLRTLRAQAYRMVEIIVVDDGSTDGTVGVAARHRRRDPRVRIVRRPNGGPSAARNTGVAAARGEFLTFLDPDDLVAPDGYAVAIATLRETGSDFAVMLYDRLEEGRRKKAGPWIRAAHATRRLRVTLDDAPEIQVNAVVWSKVFRREFYDAAGLTFAEGTIYEDQPVSARAFARAQSFDILPEILVSWRIREDGTSISQQTATVANMAAHNAAVRASLGELEEAGHAQAATARALQLLANNMRFFISHADEADDEFWDLLRTGIGELLERVPHDDYIRHVRAQDKVLNWLIARDDRERARSFLAAGGMRARDWITRNTPEGTIVELPFSDDPAAGVPADHFVLAESQRPRG